MAFTRILYLLILIVSIFERISCTAENSSLTEASTNNTSSSGSKFGLAWLFSFNTKPKISKDEEEEKNIDKRVLDTSLFLSASRGNTRVQVYKAYESDPEEDVHYCNFDDTVEKIEAREGDDVTLKCKLQNLHYQIELAKLKVEWDWIDKSACNDSSQESSMSFNDKIYRVKPDCMIFTNFPFYNLQTSSKNISCSADIVLNKVTVNDTGNYRCTTTFGFSDSPAIHSHLFADFHLRVSRRNDYYIHKIITIIIAAVVLTISFSLLFKKIFKVKLPWEGKRENYAAEWPGTVPARRIASSGSLGRRPSGPIIVEEEEEEEEDEGEEISSKGLDDLKVVVSEYIPVKSSMKKPKRESIGGIEF